MILAKCESFTLIFNRLLEYKHIVVKSREYKDEENPGGVELQPFLGPSAKGIYWSKAQQISKKINTVFQNHF